MLGCYYELRAEYALNYYKVKTGYVGDLLPGETCLGVTTTLKEFNLYRGYYK